MPISEEKLKELESALADSWPLGDDGCAAQFGRNCPPEIVPVSLSYAQARELLAGYREVAASAPTITISVAEYERIVEKILDYLSRQEYQGEPLLHAAVACDFVGRRNLITALTAAIKEQEG